MSENLKNVICDLESWGAEPKEVLKETFMDDVDFYETCLKKFAAETFLEVLKSSIADQKMEEAIRAVHTMKGNADYLGLFPVMDEAITVLKDLRAQNVEQALADIPKLESVFAVYKEKVATL